MNSKAQTPLLPLVLALLVATPGLLAAQEENPADEPQHAALRVLRAVVEEAINTNNLDLLKPHLADGFSVVTYTDREFTDFEAFKTQWQKTRAELLDGGSYETKLLPNRSLLVGDIAIARGNSENVLITGDGVKYEFTSHWSATLRNVDGQWKIVRAHSSLSPFDNPLLTAGVKKIILRVAVGALLGGLVLGWLVAWWLGRRKRTAPAS